MSEGNKDASKVHLHWAKANLFISFLPLLNVIIKLHSLWIPLEAMSLSLQYKRTLYKHCEDIVCYTLTVLLYTVRHNENLNFSSLSYLKKFFPSKAGANKQCATSRVGIAHSAERLVIPCEAVAHLISNTSPTNTCMCASMWIENGMAVMLAAKSWAGAKPEVNLKNPLLAGDKACKWGDPPWLWNPEQMSPKVQNRVSVAPKKGLMFEVPQTCVMFSSSSMACFSSSDTAPSSSSSRLGATTSKTGALSSIVSVSSLMSATVNCPPAL